MQRKVLLTMVLAMIALMLFSSFELSGPAQHRTMIAAFVGVTGAVAVDWRSRKPGVSLASLLAGIPSLVASTILIWFPPDSAQNRTTRPLYAVSMTLLASSMLGKSSTPTRPR